ncbi:MAG: hypothetical protein WDN48_01565 [Pseudolabrys sp.]
MPIHSWRGRNGLVRSNEIGRDWQGQTPAFLGWRSAAHLAIRD